MWNPAPSVPGIAAEPLDDERALLRHDDRRLREDDERDEREQDDDEQSAFHALLTQVERTRRRPSTPVTRQRCPGSIGSRAIRCAPFHIVPRSSTRPTSPGANPLARHGQLADQRIDVAGRMLDAVLQAAAKEQQIHDRRRRVKISHCTQARRRGRAGEHADGERAEAEEHHEEPAGRDQLDDQQHQPARQPHPPFHRARDYSRAADERVGADAGASAARLAGVC